MAWMRQDQIFAGQFVLGELVEGVRLDPIGVLREDEILTRVREFAQGWTPTNIVWEQGLFGIGGSVRIFGRATGTIPAESIASQLSAALNSFWTVGGARFSVVVSDSLSTPIPPDSGSWSTTLQLIAVAVIVVGVVWGVKQLREISE